MTIPATEPRVRYEGADSAGPFSIPFLFLAQSHLFVVRTVDGVEGQELDFSTTGAGDADGGELTLDVALATGDFLDIVLMVPMSQTLEYPEGGPFPGPATEQGLDKAMQAARELSYARGRQSYYFQEVTGNLAISLNDGIERYRLDLQANTDITFTNPPPAGTVAVVTLELVQDATGGRVVEIVDALFPGGAPSFSTGAGDEDHVVVRVDAQGNVRAVATLDYTA